MSGTLSTHERAIVGEELPRSAWRPKREFAHSVRKQPIIDGDAPVLYLVDTLNVGGTETQLAQVAVRLRSTSYPVTVGCLRAAGPLVEVLDRAGMSVVEFRTERTLLSVRGIYQLLRLAIFCTAGGFRWFMRTTRGQICWGCQRLGWPARPSLFPVGAIWQIQKNSGTGR